MNRIKFDNVVGIITIISAAAVFFFALFASGWRTQSYNTQLFIFNGLLVSLNIAVIGIFILAIRSIKRN